MNARKDTQGAPWPTYGKLAKDYLGAERPLEILRSERGFYIGTADEEGPCSREYEEYFPDRHKAEEALKRGHWTQRQQP